MRVKCRSAGSSYFIVLDRVGFFFKYAFPLAAGIALYGLVLFAAKLEFGSRYCSLRPRTVCCQTSSLAANIALYGFLLFAARLAFGSKYCSVWLPPVCCQTRVYSMPNASHLWVCWLPPHLHPNSSLFRIQTQNKTISYNTITHNTRKRDNTTPYKNNTIQDHTIK